MDIKPIFVTATDLNDAYFQLLTFIWEHGRRYKITSGSYEGSERFEFDFCAGFIRYPHSRPLAPIMPEGIPPTVTDEELETKYFPNYLMNPELDPTKNEHYKYASWINGCDYYNEFRFLSCDGPFPEDCIEYIGIEEARYHTKPIRDNTETPLEWVIRHFKEKGYGNNHCFINIGNVDSGFNYDIPYENEADRRTSPCLRGIDFKIKHSYLIMNCIFRSWDLYAGFPENMGGLTLLNEYICEQLGDVQPGPLGFTSAGLHIYDFHLSPVIAILRKDNLDESK